ncbi:MAG: c-type cytochrome domain-containing protein [Magnetospiraceae bacterium]
MKVAKMVRQWTVGAAVLGVGVLISSGAVAKDTSFSEDVAPLLKQYCAECHTPPDGVGYKASGLDVTSHTAVMAGTSHGSIITPGDASLSNLMLLIEGQADPSIKMPHNKGFLPKKERNVIRRWINEGALDN